MSRLDTLEERIEKPGYLLFLVAILLLLIIGFVNVVSHEGDGTTVLGVYSVRQAAVIVAFLAAILGWGFLLRKPNHDRWLHRVLDWVTDRPVFGLALFAAYAVALWHMMTQPRWLFFPVLQTAIILGMAIVGGLVLFYQWTNPAKPRLWRRTLVTLFAGAIALEVVMQLLAAATLLPSLNTPEDAFAPYDRIYFQADSGTTNTLANRYGYHYPEFRLAEGSHRIALLGDQFLQALQVPGEANVGVALERELAGAALFDRDVEVLSLGDPDFGPGAYLNVPLFLFPEAEFEPDEVVVFFDFSNDFQIINASDGHNIYFYRDGDELGLSDEDFLLRHDYLHEVLWGLEGYQPRRFLRSHYLTLRLARTYLGADNVVAASYVPAPQDDVALPNSFVFYENTNDDALFIAMSLLRTFHEHTREAGIKLSIVTIPVFPDDFYLQAQNTAWTTRFGAADLFLPERELRAFAAEQGISFLAMGEYMRETGLSTAEIQALYFEQGRGQFTPAGHELFATAAFNCFYATTIDAAAGCDLVQ